MATTATGLLNTTVSVASLVGVGAALYAVLGPRSKAPEAGRYAVGAILVGAGAGVAASLLQGSSLQLPGATGTGRIAPLRVGGVPA